MPRVDLDPAELGSKTYPWLTSVVVPRPIAWVSSRSTDGVDNLAPHSFFSVAGINPPVLMFTSVGEKDSLRNIVATREFVVSTCTEALMERVNLTGTDYPPGQSEFDAVGLTREPSLGWPRRGWLSRRSPWSAGWSTRKPSGSAPWCSVRCCTSPSPRT